MIRNENKYREERIRLARNKESKEREKKQIESQKIEASRVKRQKLIEEARLKEQSSTAEKLKELQNRTVISHEKEELLEKREKEKKTNTQSTLKTEEKIKNPLENKSLEEMLKYDDKFDTNELFENTKIVPNRVSDTSLVEDSLFKEVSSSQKEEEIPLWQPVPTSEDKVAFKEDNTSPVKMEVNSGANEEVKAEKFPSIDNSTSNSISEVEEVKVDNSIYDILENNQNIIWKSTQNNQVLNEVPVIQNKNKSVKMEDKEGEVLWKETI